MRMRSPRAAKATVIAPEETFAEAEHDLSPVPYWHRLLGCSPLSARYRWLGRSVGQAQSRSSSLMRQP